MEPRQKIISEILQERTSQTDKYSNTKDDTYTRNKSLVWRGLILSYIDDIGRTSNRIMRKRFIQVAALCIAAIESHDRLHGKDNG